MLFSNTTRSMVLPPGTSGRGTAELLEPAFAFLDPRGSDAVDERQDLSLQPQQLRAGLTEPPVLVGEFSQGGKLFGREAEVSRSALAAVAQHAAGMKLSSGTTAGGLSAAAAEGVERAGQERLAAEERFQQRRELSLEFKDLPAEDAEVVRHGWAWGKRAVSVEYNTYTSTEIKARKKKSGEGQNCRIQVVQNAGAPLHDAESRGIAAEAR